MSRKIICILICFLLVLISIPLINSEKFIEKPINNVGEDEYFISCYISIEGSIFNQWKINFLKPFGDDRATVLFWHLEFKPNTEITILTEENGEVLYNFQGEKQLNILAFRGIYISQHNWEEDHVDVSINGKVTLVKPRDTSTNSDNTDTTTMKNVLGEKQRFTNCYFEISGYMHNDWPAIIKLPNMFQLLWIQSANDINDVIFGTYSYIYFEEDAEITVYSEENGEVIWQHEGQIDPFLTMIGFKGSYSYVDPDYELPIITLSGNALFASIILKDHY
jgi:hypothetical protein